MRMLEYYTHAQGRFQDSITFLCITHNCKEKDKIRNFYNASHGFGIDLHVGDRFIVYPKEKT